VGQTPSKDDELDEEMTVSGLEEESSNPHSEVKGFSVVDDDDDDDDDENFDYYDDDDDDDDENNEKKKKHGKEK
jgi:hypothetical protein